MNLLLLELLLKLLLVLLLVVLLLLMLLSIRRRSPRQRLAEAQTNEVAAAAPHRAAGVVCGETREMSNNKAQNKHF